MPLRVRLSLAFVAIVIVPLGVTVFLIQYVISRNLDISTQGNVSRASRSVSSVIAQLDKRAGAAALDVAETLAIQQAVRDGKRDVAQRLVRLKYEGAREAGVEP
ncbi:MAG: hypothetical protein ABIM89_11070, partial [Mycobacteriales bacterium]